MESSFEFALGDRVLIAASQEQGVVIGAATYDHNENQFLLRYAAADGRAVEAWWGQSALTAAV